MIATLVKGGFVKRGPKIINYRDYSKFNIESFRKNLKDSLLRQNQQASKSYDVFNTIVLSVLNKHAPMKRKSISANEGPFMTKALRKAIMNRLISAINIIKTELTIIRRLSKIRETYA